MAAPSERHREVGTPATPFLIPGVTVYPTVLTCGIVPSKIREVTPDNAELDMGHQQSPLDAASLLVRVVSCAAISCNDSTGEG